jgi:hypothetical protein
VAGRYSTCCTETRRGHTRSLALVGKLFPTTDSNHAQPLSTASFITQQDIAGEHTDYINDAELRNAPDVHAWRRGSGALVCSLQVRSFSSLIRSLRTANCTKSLRSVSQRASPREAPSSFASWSRQSNPELKVKHQTFVTKSWRRFLTTAMLRRNAPSPSPSM